MRTTGVGLTLLVLTACGLTGPDEEGLSATLSTEVVETGGEIRFTFTNASPMPALTGLLVCTVEYDTGQPRW